jgi:hypothetical protein
VTGVQIFTLKKKESRGREILENRKFKEAEDLENLLMEIVQIDFAQQKYDISALS